MELIHHGTTVTRRAWTRYVAAAAAKEDISIVRVPGAFEIPSQARTLAQSGKYDAIVTLGCLIRGETTHYEHISTEVTRGIGQSAQENRRAAHLRRTNL